MLGVDEEKVETEGQATGKAAPPEAIGVTAPAPVAMPGPPRKAVAEIEHPDEALVSALDRARALQEKIDARDGTANAGRIPDARAIKAPKELKPQFSESEIIAMIGSSADALGQALDVESRPLPMAVAIVGMSGSALSAHLPATREIPVEVLAGVFLVGCGICALPMIMEARRIKAGQLLPASERPRPAPLPPVVVEPESSPVVEAQKIARKAKRVAKSTPPPKKRGRPARA